MIVLNKKKNYRYKIECFFSHKASIYLDDNFHCTNVVYTEVTYCISLIEFIIYLKK